MCETSRAGFLVLDVVRDTEGMTTPDTFSGSRIHVGVGTFRVHELGPDPERGTVGAVGDGSHNLAYWFEEGLVEPRKAHEVVDRGWCSVSMAVPAQWRKLRADFRQQVLNVPFADLLTRLRPQRVHVEALHGCTLDLPRLARWLGCPVQLSLPQPHELRALPERTFHWVAAAMSAATALDLPPGLSAEDYPDALIFREPSEAEAAAPSAGGREAGGLDYAMYEFVLRDHPLLWRMQEGYARFFEGCTDILDVGCGTGVFLGILEAAGLQAQGVDRNPPIVRYAQELGFDVYESDALDWLERHPCSYDGIYCSHFVEHLAIDGVERLLHLMARALRPGGRVVLVFPDPESIRSQLLGFWRDPEHVRFYHPELIELIGRSLGLDCVWHSHREGVTHDVVAFPSAPSVDGLPPDGVRDSPPPPPVQPSTAARRGLARGLRTHILQFLGLAPASTVRRLEDRLHASERHLAALETTLAQSRETLACIREDTRRLWQVNQTWAWEDNAVLVLRRQERSESEEPSGNG